MPRQLARKGLQRPFGQTPFPYEADGSAQKSRQRQQKPQRGAAFPDRQRQRRIGSGRLKAAFRARDRLDGERRKLNLGHSFGHAIEKCSEFGISHGLAVAAGMAIITKAAVAKGFCEAGALPRLLSLLEKYGLPTDTDFSAARLAEAALSDKKFSGGRIHLIVPEKVGRCRILPVPASELADWLKAGGVL